MVAGGVLLLLLVGACRDAGAPAGSGSVPTTQPASGGAGEGEGAYGGAYGGSSSTKSADPLTIQEGVGGGFAFAPSRLNVRRGQTITLENVGEAPHTFTIEDQGIDVTNGPREVKRVTVDLSPGTYPFACRFHRDQGMKGTLTVTS